jgi:hypothetical protein
VDTHQAHFRLCHELKLSLHELLGWAGPLTHRQCVAWSVWLERQWNKPTRSDHYAMQVAAEVRLCRRAFTNGEPVSLSDMKIPFTSTPSLQGKTEGLGENGWPAGWTQEQEDEFQRHKANMEKTNLQAVFGPGIVEKRMTKAEHAHWLETGEYPERLKG